MNEEFHLYEGQGRRLVERDEDLPPFENEKFTSMHDAKNYRADRPLQHAVNVAVALGQPLLLTGEPGTGKTELANSVAYEFGLPLLPFHTKTSSIWRDLFYEYDALGHFHDASLSQEKAAPGQRLNAEKYISYKALGMAILLTYPPGAERALLPKEHRDKKPTRAVVLIDEIDKAPRDLPNDVLHEIERLSFTVKETGREFKTDQSNRPIVILTSNSEKNLPDAFLRRCVYYHISFPDQDPQRLREIIESRFGKDAFTTLPLMPAIERFLNIRKAKLKKPPATAELMAWLEILNRLGLRFDGQTDKETAQKMQDSYSVLAKNNDDLERLKKEFPTV